MASTFVWLHEAKAEKDYNEVLDTEDDDYKIKCSQKTKTAGIREEKERKGKGKMILELLEKR